MTEITTNYNKRLHSLPWVAIYFFGFECPYVNSSKAYSKHKYLLKGLYNRLKSHINIGGIDVVMFQIRNRLQNDSIAIIYENKFICIISMIIQCHDYYSAGEQTHKL